MAFNFEDYKAEEVRLTTIYLALPPGVSLEVACTEDCTEVYNWQAMLTDEERTFLERYPDGFQDFIWKEIEDNDKRGAALKK